MAAKLFIDLGREDLVAPDDRLTAMSVETPQAAEKKEEKKDDKNEKKRGRG